MHPMVWWPIDSSSPAYSIFSFVHLLFHLLLYLGATAFSVKPRFQQRRPESLALNVIASCLRFARMSLSSCGRDLPCSHPVSHSSFLLLCGCLRSRPHLPRALSRAATTQTSIAPDFQNRVFTMRSTGLRLSKGGPSNLVVYLKKSRQEGDYGSKTFRTLIAWSQHQMMIRPTSKSNNRYVSLFTYRIKQNIADSSGVPCLRDRQTGRLGLSSSTPKCFSRSISLCRTQGNA